MAYELTIKNSARRKYLIKVTRKGIEPGPPFFTGDCFEYSQKMIIC